MAVESADDLAGFFDPDEFGEPMVATIGLTPVRFSGIYTDGPVSNEPGSVAGITGYVPRVIAPRAALSGLASGDLITRADGKEFAVNDLQFKDKLLIIYLHDSW